jgi:hypothetical protein
MPTHPFLRLASASSLAVLLLAAPAFAQGAGGSPVRVEFRATSDDGVPVADLKPSDVSVKLDGKPRELKSLQFVRAPEAAAGPRPSSPPFATNTGAGRTFVLLLDEESVGPGKEGPLRDALLAFVGSVGPSDRVGLTSVRRGGVAIGATANLETMRTAVKDLRGQALSETVQDFQCRTSVTLQALRELLAGPAATPQTTFLYISAGMSPPPQTQVRVGQTSGLCQLETRQFEQVGTAASASPASIFVAYYVDGMAAPTSDSIAGVENVAGVVQTTLIRLAGSNVDALTRVTKATSGRYIASFEPEAGERNGGLHRLELRVGRDRVNVRAPSSITIPKGEKPPTPRDMLRVPTAYRDLPLRASAMSSRNPGDDKIKIITLVEAGEPGTKLTGVAIGFIDAKNKLAAQWTAQEADLSRPLLLSAVTIPPGAYRMRVAAVDASGRAGAADTDLQAALVNAGQLKLSTPMLGVSGGGNFVPRLQFTSTDAAAIGYVEIYGVPANGNISVTLELAPSDDAPAMATAATQVQGKDDMRAAFGGFDISRLAAGDYVLRALVSLDGTQVGRTLRTMRKAE